VPQRRIYPPALILGAVGSFIACCLAGRLVGQRNCFVGFERFHHAICPQSLFYPTARQVRALGRDLLDRNHIAVVVGGSSVLRGAGQRPEALWTRRLQEKLGDRYRVLNLAMDCAFPGEFGGTAAEILARDFPRLIFISDVALGYAGPRQPSASARAAIPFGCRYPDFFWEAYYKGLLSLEPAREAAVRSCLDAKRADAAFAETARGLSVDAVVYSRDLWATIAYRWLSTVWCPGGPQPFTRARRFFADAGEKSQMAVVRYSPEAVAITVADLRFQLAAARHLRQRPAGSAVVTNELLSFPPALQGRTLLVARRSSPDSLAHLRPEELAEYRGLLTLFAHELERAGFAVVQTGAAYTEADFIDSCHLSDAGGQKFADEVAPAVRRLARRLGY
jgi:hypothetical protein